LGRLRISPPELLPKKECIYLAIISKSFQAVQTTIIIVETFVKIWEFSHIIDELSKTPEKIWQKALM
jgi:hypothetical protein